MRVRASRFRALATMTQGLKQGQQKAKIGRKGQKITENRKAKTENMDSFNIILHLLRWQFLSLESSHTSENLPGMIHY